MGGFFAVVSNGDCVNDLFYGTDYHSHLGTRRAGLAVLDSTGFSRSIHNIENAQFRSKFVDDLSGMQGHMGIGCISDTEDQPLLIGSHLGTFAIVTVGRINNMQDLVQGAFGRRLAHFSEMSDGEVNPTELVATLISGEETFEEGLRKTQDVVDGSCSILLLTHHGVYAARDRYGRTPLVIGEKNGTLCASLESCAFPTLGYQFRHELGPGEIVLLSADGLQSIQGPNDTLRMCGFFWVYFGYPASTYEGMNVELMRNRSGAALARREQVQVDAVAGIPDSGTAHAIGYANEAGIPYCRPFIKYTPTWPRSFMPQDQAVRDLVARMKLIPIRELIEGKRLLFCEDSIVRGTQLKETIQLLYDYQAREVHMRPACPPLIFSCKFLNFSRSRSELNLAGRRAIREIEGRDVTPGKEYCDPQSDKFQTLVDHVRDHLHLTTLRYQTMSDMLEAIGLPKEKVCTYCWDGQG